MNQTKPIPMGVFLRVIARLWIAQLRLRIARWGLWLVKTLRL
jgi:hypothetical protein